MLRAIGRAIAAAARMAAASVAAVGKTAWMGLEAMSATYEWLVDVGVECIKLPFEVFDYGMTRILGRGSQPIPQPSAERTSAADLKQDFAEAAARHAGSRQAITEVSSVGETVHAYASEPRDTRREVNLRNVPEHIQHWLDELSEDDLARLAKAGPAACSCAANGKRCGVIGLKLPSTYEEAAARLAETSTYDVLQSRIRNKLTRGKDYRAA